MMKSSRACPALQVVAAQQKCVQTHLLAILKVRQIINCSDNASLMERTGNTSCVPE